MRIVPDFTELVDLQPIPDGVYKARILAVEEKKSKAGNDYLNWKAQIFGAEGELEKFNNRLVFIMTMVNGSNSSLKLLKQMMTLKGVGPEFDTDDILGLECELVCQSKPNEDGTPRINPDVKRIQAIK